MKLDLLITKFINRLRDKRIPIESDQALDELLKKFTKDGRQLFETYVKKNPKVYLSEKPNYRTYILENIQYCYEIRFEDGFLRQLFGEGSNTTTQRQVIENEINENDG